MRLDNLLSNRQPQPKARCAVRFVMPPEPFEDVRQRLFTDANSGIHDLDHSRLALLLSGDLDGLSAGREANRIINDVDKGDMQPDTIRVDRRKRGYLA